MGQIPTYGVIGSGRLAHHLIHYFTCLDLDLITWSRKHNTVVDLQKLAQKADVILVLINDDAIEDFIHTHPFLKEKTLVHCSGRLGTKLAKGVHPLMSFGPDLYDLQTYQQLTFVVDADADFKQLFPAINNRFYPLSNEHKAYYHALCVMGGNFTTILWAKLFQEFEKRLKIPKEAAYPYLDVISHNLKTDYRSALTGPVARGDHKTIEAHLAVLSQDGFLPIYRSFVDMMGEIK